MPSAWHMVRFQLLWLTQNTFYFSPTFVPLGGSCFGSQLPLSKASWASGTSSSLACSWAQRGQGGRCKPHPSSGPGDLGTERSAKALDGIVLVPDLQELPGRTTGPQASPDGYSSVRGTSLRGSCGREKPSCSCGQPPGSVLC